MMSDRLRALTAAALAAAVAVAAASCARERVRRDNTFTAPRRLGESTASPGADPGRPLASAIDTQEVSAPISRPPASAPPAAAPGEAAPPAAEPAAPPAAEPADTGSPGVFAPPPSPQS